MQGFSLFFFVGDAFFFLFPISIAITKGYAELFFLRTAIKRFFFALARAFCLFFYKC